MAAVIGVMVAGFGGVAHGGIQYTATYIGDNGDEMCICSTTISSLPASRSPISSLRSPTAAFRSSVSTISTPATRSVPIRTGP